MVRRSAADRALSDSPWFWVLAFSVVGLAASAAMGPKFAYREARRERMAEARQKTAAQIAAGEDVALAPEEVDSNEPYEARPNQVTLTALLVLFGAGAAVAAAMLWKTRSRPLTQGPAQSDAAKHPSRAGAAP
jgi:hypothetical protein